MAESQPTHTPPEEWRDITGYEGYYQVSDHGRVRSLDRFVMRWDGFKNQLRGKPVAPASTESGHLFVGLSRDGKRNLRFVHRLVLEAFVGPCPEGMECCHNDGIPGNNHVSNLRWDTRSSNHLDSVRHGTDRDSSKTHCPRGHELKHPNLRAAAMKRGKRNCLACARADSFIYRNRHLRDQFQNISDDYHRKIIEEKGKQHG